MLCIEKCDFDNIHPGYPCVDGYTTTGEDTKQYCPSWKEKEDGSNCKESGYISNAWSYVDSSKIWGLSVSADYTTYAGGGYFFLLDDERNKSLRQINDAKQRNWIDRRTRAVMVEFNLYNPNSDMFINGVFVLEFLEQGFAIPDVILNPFTKSLNFDECSTSLQSSFIIFTLYTIVLLVHLAHQVYCRCKAVVTTLWFWIDVLLGLTGISVLVLFVYRKGVSDEAGKLFFDQQYTGENNFINYYQIVVLNMVIQVLLGFISFIAILRILRAFEYSKRLSAFWTVIADSVRPLLGYFFIFVITMCAFASLVYLLFGKYLNTFRNLTIVFGSLANTLIGKNDIVVLINVSPFFAMLFYFAYGCTVTFLLLNIFAAILNETISQVKKDANEADIFGIGDYTLSLLKSVRTTLNPMKIKRVTTAKEQPDKGIKSKDTFSNDISIHLCSFLNVYLNNFHSPALQCGGRTRTDRVFHCKCSSKGVSTPQSG